MRICIVGKFPPIEGGVSMRTYWTAHRLAKRGHDVHVVTNAKEVQPPFRMHMRDADWARCDADYGMGRVSVHWTDPADHAQRTVPMASAFVSKLAGLAGRIHAETPLDVVFSHYLEPYGVAGHLAAQIANVPHVVRMAGSDAGRLWHHPQLEALYDHVLRSAHAVLAVGPSAQRAAAQGVDSDRIVSGGGFAVPEDLFAVDGPMLNLSELREEVQESETEDQLWGEFAGDSPCIGVYGKLGETKGSFSLLVAFDRLIRAGHDVGLLVMAHGAAHDEQRFREEARALGLEESILQIPFLPHWRVPEFMGLCFAVCCLEQGFPISAHNPIMPREVMLNGTCLVGSTEVIRKLPQFDRIVHGYNCLAVRNVHDVSELADVLAVVAANSKAADAIGARGRTAALEMQSQIEFPVRLERILGAAALRAPVHVDRPTHTPPKTLLDGLVEESQDDGLDSLFRLESRHWPIKNSDCGTLVAVRNSHVRVYELDDNNVARMVALGGTRNPLVIDKDTARILELCDGQRTVSEIASEIGGEGAPSIARRIEWIQYLFAIGLIGFRDADAERSSRP